MNLSKARNILNFCLLLTSFIAITFGIYTYQTSSVFNPRPTFAQSCQVESCQAGWHSCYGGSMCCWDGGCPTYMCQKWCDKQEQRSNQAGCTAWNSGNVAGVPGATAVSCTVYSKDGWHQNSGYIGQGGCYGCGGGGGGGCQECKKDVKGCSSSSASYCGEAKVPGESGSTAKCWTKCTTTDGLKCTKNISHNECKNPSNCKGSVGDVCNKNGTKNECEWKTCGVVNVKGPVTTDMDPTTYIYGDPLDIVFEWSKPKSWGNTCSEPCDQAGFRLFVDGINIKSFGLSVLQAVYDSDSFAVGTHSWFIRAYRTGASSVDSITRSFTITSPAVTVRGYLWDATGQSCAANPDPGLEIPSSGVTVKVDGTQSATVDQNPGTPYTFSVGNVSVNGHYLAVENLPEPPGQPGTAYQLTCVNGLESGSSNFSASADPTTVNLGYRPVSTAAWTQAFNGNVHTNNLLSYLRPPAEDQFHGQYLLSARGEINLQVVSEPGWLGALYPQGNLSVFDNFPIPSPTYSQMRSLYGRGASASATLPAAGTLANGGIYRVTQSEVINGVYNVPSGVRALIFVDGTLTINGEIRTPSNAYLAFITRDGINIDKKLAGGGPDQDAIQATLISEGVINTAYNRSDTTEIHRQLLIEGNLISLTNTLFLYRNLGEEENIDNPAEIVRPRISSFIRAKNVLGKPRVFWREIPAGAQ